MRYNDRIKLIRKTKSKDPMKSFDLVESAHVCRITGLQMDMNIGVFGQYQPNGLAVHLRGIHSDVYQIEYNGAKITPKAILATRGNTIIVLGG